VLTKDDIYILIDIAIVDPKQADLLPLMEFKPKKGAIAIDTA
jgi:hypothetical protein